MHSRKNASQANAIEQSKINQMAFYSAEDNAISISLPSLSRVVVFLPIFGLVFAVLWSISFDKERSTSTACHASNFIPSVSAAIALTPQAYVWRICITLHSLPRYWAIYGYWIWYSKQQYSFSNFFYPLRTILKIVSTFANFVELTALLGLTVISSRENKPIHESCFVIFMVGSLLCMVSSCILNSIIQGQSQRAKTSTRRKIWCTIINLLTFAISLYFYFRHNYYCEDGIYSMFAVCEYIVILSNMGFHYTVSLDFCNQLWCCVEKNPDQVAASKLS